MSEASLLRGVDTADKADAGVPIEGLNEPGGVAGAGDATTSWPKDDQLSSTDVSAICGGLTNMVRAKKVTGEKMTTINYGLRKHGATFELKSCDERSPCKPQRGENPHYCGS